MHSVDTIPIFELFGETAAFPDVLHWERIRDRASEHGWSISAHRHTQMSQLFLIESGVADAKIDDQNISVATESYLYIPPHAVHQFSFAPDTEGSVLSIPLDVISRLGPVASDTLSGLRQVVIGTTPPELSLMIQLFSQRYSHGGAYRSLCLVGLAHAILSIIAEAADGSTVSVDSTQNQRIKNLDTLITANLANHWGPSDYASALSLSTGHLGRLCKNALGMSTSTYIDKVRMTEATRLLAFTQMHVADVGYRLGFSDPSYFTRRFQKVRGQTPTEYREQFLDT